MKKSIKIVRASNCDKKKWNDYVLKNHNGSVYQLFQWKNIIEDTYKHKTFYLMAIDETSVVKGLFPLVYINSIVFGKRLISIPFFDNSGILCSNMEVEKKFIDYSLSLALELNADAIEIRNIIPNSYIEKNELNLSNSDYNINRLFGHKAVMVLDLPKNPEDLFNSYKSKFRNNIKRPYKKNLTFNAGKDDLLNDFYKVFAINMRDLGSPVHSKKLFKNIIKDFKDKTYIGVVYKGNQPIAGILTIGFKETLYNPFASSLKDYKNLRANIFQYWNTIEYACKNKYSFFNFGRSTPGEGTYNFKKQWGAKPYLLTWYNFSKDKKDSGTDKSDFNKLIKIWQKIPVPISKIAGPKIRKNIGL